MAENNRPPVAIRIVRPYDTEDELLENELETIGKTNVILIGAHPRPTGVILRFEVTLQTGATVLRGEGRVLAHKDNAFRGQAGLSLRFTRLDPRSKGVVDRATAMREARSPSNAPSRPPPRPMSDPAIADALTASTPEPAAAAAPAAAPDPAPAPERAPAPAAPNLPPQPPAVIADDARARARAAANAAARVNATRTRPVQEPVGLTPPPVPTAAEPEEEDRAEPTSHVGQAQQTFSPHEAVTRTAAMPEPTPVTSIPGEVEMNVQIARDTDDASEAVTLPPKARAPEPAPRASSSARFVDPPAGRADLLARLRDRAGKLPPQRVAEILASRR